MLLRERLTVVLMGEDHVGVQQLVERDVRRVAAEAMDHDVLRG